jgi:hypothetical protein
MTMNVEWLVALSVSIIVAVIGWTLTASLASRMKMFGKVEKDLVRLEAVVSAADTRISVLESQHTNVMSALTRIEALLQAHLGKI